MKNDINPIIGDLYIVCDLKCTYKGTRGRNCHIFKHVNNDLELAFSNDQLANCLENGEIRPNDIKQG